MTIAKGEPYKQLSIKEPIKIGLLKFQQEFSIGSQTEAIQILLNSFYIKKENKKREEWEFKKKTSEDINNLNEKTNSIVERMNRVEKNIIELMQLFYKNNQQQS